MSSQFGHRQRSFNLIFLHEQDRKISDKQVNHTMVMIIYTWFVLTRERKKVNLGI